MQIGFFSAERGGIAGNRKQLKSIASLLLLLFCRCSVMNDYRTRRRRKQDCWRRLINPVGQTASSEKSKTSIPYQQEQPPNRMRGTSIPYLLRSSRATTHIHGRAHKPGHRSILFGCQCVVGSLERHHLRSWPEVSTPNSATAFRLLFYLYKTLLLLEGFENLDIHF